MSIHKTIVLGLVTALAAGAIATPLAAAIPSDWCDSIEESLSVVYGIVPYGTHLDHSDPVFHQVVQALRDAGCDNPFCFAYSLLIGGDCAPPVPVVVDGPFGNISLDAYGVYTDALAHVDGVVGRVSAPHADDVAHLLAPVGLLP